MHGQKNFTIFVLEILLKYQVTNGWLKNLLMWSNKEADFFSEIKKKAHFPWNGPRGVKSWTATVFRYKQILHIWFKALLIF